MYFLKNNQPNSKQVDKTTKESQLTGTLGCSTNGSKKLSVQKCQDASSSTIVTTHQSVQPSKSLTSQSKSLSSYTEICLEDKSIKVNSSGQHIAIKRPALKSESTLSTKKNTSTR